MHSVSLISISENSFKSIEDQVLNKQNFFLLSEKKGLSIFFFRLLIGLTSFIIPDFNDGILISFLFSSSFQTFIISSSEPLTKHFPFWFMATVLKRSPWPAKVNSSIYSVAISQDGKYAISGSNDKTIKVWNLEEKREEFTLTGHSSSVTSVAISKDGKYIISGSSDKTIKIWSLEEKREELTLKGHSFNVNSFAISQDGKYLVSGSSDRTIKV